jgi:hypothetical protein
MILNLYNRKLLKIERSIDNLPYTVIIEKIYLKRKTNFWMSFLI